MTATDRQTDPELAASVWDLSPLVDGDEQHGADSLLDGAAARAQELARAHAGRVRELDAAGLTGAMGELAVIRDLIERADMYAQLRFAADSGDVANGALVQRVKERVAAIETTLQFFDLEWIAADEEWAALVLREAGEQLSFAAHHLRTLRRRRPHTLSEPEERILTERRITGEQAWARLYEEQYSATEVELDGEQVPFGVAYTQAMDADRDKRVAAVDAMIAATAPIGRERAYIYNTLIHDHAVEDRLRGYPTWLSSRNLQNQIDDQAVAALVAAVQARHDIPHRWYRSKAALLGVDRLSTYDLSAPLHSEETPLPYREARDLVLGAYRDLAPEAGEIVRRFFDERWIDAPVRSDKMGGAFCANAGERINPFVLLNYTGRRYDVLAMAHELGHALHAMLAMPAGIFHQNAPITVCETASTFGESLVIERMLEHASDDRTRLSLLAEALEGSIATIFQQTAYNQFEERAHSRRRSEGELTAEQLDELFAQVSAGYLGDAVDQVPGSERAWSMIPHFFLWPGYVYGYAFGQLFSLSVYARYREIGSSFVPVYLEMLSAGGSCTPQELGQIVGVDLSDPGFWASGLELVDAQLRAVEELAAAVANSDPA